MAGKKRGWIWIILRTGGQEEAEGDFGVAIAISEHFAFPLELDPNSSRKGSEILMAKRAIMKMYLDLLSDTTHWGLLAFTPISHDQTRPNCLLERQMDFI